MKNIILTIILWAIVLFGNSLYASPKLWTEVSPAAQRSSSHALFKHMPNRYRLFQLNEKGIRNYLNTPAYDRAAPLSIPLPNGEMIQLIISETSVMAPALAAKYPQIKTYKAKVVGRPGVQGVVNMNKLGFHGMLFMEDGQRLFIDPRKSSSGAVYYISYYDSDYHPAGKRKPKCETDTAPRTQDSTSTTSDIIQKKTLVQRTGENLTTYRLAMAATGEYTDYHFDDTGTGTIIEQALSAISTTIARVNQIYERDLAVKLVLVADNDQIIFTDAANDPYTDNNDSYQLIEENQAAIDNIIGSSNYDIGHLFTHNNGGGLAYTPSVCDGGNKAKAVTGLNAPENDPFDIDYVAHEIGHQFGGSHSFNAADGGCYLARSTSTAWEIGNGVTIMGYAGVCDVLNDVESNSIAMFHAGNIREMSLFINDSSQGSSCGAASTLNNQQPVADAGEDYIIPAETPFQLTGTATDADGDALSYSWEQMDLGNIANIDDGDKGNNPLFRVYLPSNIDTRTFPPLSDIVSNTHTIGEILPTTTRDLTFTFTVRDQNGGVADDDVVLSVFKTSTPFKITSHAAPAVLDAGSTADILWDTGDTQSPPINCAQVDILLSIDGGNNFANYLAQNTANDGNETVIIPADIGSNSSTRFKVACSNNIFFDISDDDLTIINTGTINCSETALTIGDTQYTSNTIEQSESSILADGLIIVEKGVNVSYQAPSITLKPGFHAESGSLFTARAMMTVSCDLLQSAAAAEQARPSSVAAEEPADIQLNTSSPIAQWLSISELPISLKQLLADKAADAKEFMSDAANTFLVFSSTTDLLANDSNRLSDIYLYNNETETLSLISATAESTSGNGDSTQGRINGSGQYIVYRSEADNLLSQIVDTNGVADIFLYHIPDAVQTRISYQTDGSQTRESSANPAIAGDKPYLVYDKTDNHQQHVYGVDITTDNISAIKYSIDYNNFGELIDNRQPAISTDGRYIVYLGRSKDDKSTCTQHILDRVTGNSQVTLCPDEIAENPERWYPFFDAKAENIHWQRVE